MAAVVFRYIHHYRREFYEQLRQRLRSADIDLRLIAGQAGPQDAAKDDAVALPWALQIRNRYLTLGDKELCWQPALRAAWDADLVIVEQASRLLLNYALLASRRCGGPKVAMWGHGENIQPHRASRSGEAVKRSVSRRVDWWFAYTRTSASTVQSLGFPAARTTVVQNAIDTTGLARLREELTESDLETARSRWGIKGSHVGVFSGSLYPDKRLGFLIAASDLVRCAVPDFELVVLGSGVDAPLVRAAAASRPWLHALGPLYHMDKALALSLAQVALVPGLVGLGILDGFALGLPLVTTKVPFHSHEIEYLIHGENGIMVDDWKEPSAFADAIARVLLDARLRSRLKAGCDLAARRYTIEAMSANFAEGVRLAIEAPPRRRGGAE